MIGANAQTKTLMAGGTGAGLLSAQVVPSTRHRPLPLPRAVEETVLHCPRSRGAVWWSVDACSPMTARP